MMGLASCFWVRIPLGLESEKVTKQSRRLISLQHWPHEAALDCCGLVGGQLRVRTSVKRVLRHARCMHDVIRTAAHSLFIVDMAELTYNVLVAIPVSHRG